MLALRKPHQKALHNQYRSTRNQENSLTALYPTERDRMCFRPAAIVSPGQSAYLVSIPDSTHMEVFYIMCQEEKYASAAPLFHFICTLRLRKGYFYLLGTSGGRNSYNKEFDCPLRDFGRLYRNGHKQFSTSNKH